MFAALDLLDGRIVVPRGARVLIKVNLCLLLGHETGATVDPSLVRYLIEASLKVIAAAGVEPRVRLLAEMLADCDAVEEGKAAAARRERDLDEELCAARG